MKKLYSLLLFAAAGISQLAYGQIDSYILYDNNDSVTGCQSSFVIEFSIQSSPETDGIVTIDWGDGTTETEHITTSPGESMTGIIPTHGYALTGTYTVNVTVYSTTAGAFVDGGQSISITANDPANCGYIYINTVQSSPSASYINVPYDFTGADGITTTIYPNGNGFGAYTGLNIANAPYSIAVNPVWLTNNGLVQVSGNLTINSFNQTGMADNPQQTMQVACAIAANDPDFAINYAYGWGFAAPLQSGMIGINICNYACSNTADAAVSLTFPAGLTPNTTYLTNPSVNGNTLTFEIPGLTDCAYFEIPFDLPGNTPAGTEYEFWLSVNHPNDTDLNNNNDTIYVTVLNSYDPNDKSANKPMYIDASAQETIQYLINFQNEGNFDALDVVIRDTISPLLDLSTFTVLGSKHGVATTVDPATRVVTFSFNDIYLAPASQDEEASKGYVVYSIRENAGLPVNSEINNTAYIYFDFNPAIITNTTVNINAVLGIQEQSSEMLTMFPNPATTGVRFNGAIVQSARIYDMTGKCVLETSSVNNNELSTASLDNGLYQVIVSTEKGLHNLKLIVRN